MFETNALSLTNRNYSSSLPPSAERLDAPSKLDVGCACGICARCEAVAPSQPGQAAAVFEKSPEAEKLSRLGGTGSAKDAQARQTDLSPEEQAEVEDLKKREAEVRQHEQAHLAAAGSYALGGPVYEYTTGPDGRRYASGGEVQIDTSPIVGDPEATLIKAQTIKRAALAPAEPSDQDFRVAAQADQMAVQARQELAVQPTAAVCAYDRATQNPQDPLRSSRLNFVI